VCWISVILTDVAYIVFAILSINESSCILGRRVSVSVIGHHGIPNI